MAKQSSPKEPLCFLTIEQAAAGLQAGAFTSVQLTEACLSHIEKIDPSFNIMIRVDRDLALAQAKASDDRRKDGQSKGILDGIPYNLKDVYATKDSPTTAASHILDNWWAPYNATVYQKLTDAGAVLLGKTNTDEFTMGSSTETSYYGVTRNPWDPERVSGGSSGGPAASVAAHFGMFSIGTDTGGSIRLPAAFCGVTGLRPTYGRVSRFGEIPMASSLDQTGPITKNVRDAAIVLSVIAGYDHLDATSSPLEVSDYLAACNTTNLKGIKVGIPKEYFGQGVKPEVATLVNAAIEDIKRLGASVKEVSVPLANYALAAYYIIAPAEISSNMSRYDGIRFGHSVERSEKGKPISLYDVYARSRAEGLGTEVKRRIMLGTYVLSAGYYDAYYVQAERLRREVAEQFDEVFEDVDIMLAPVSPHTAFKIGERIGDPLAMYMEDILTVPLNIAGIPGMSVPCGFVDGLPVGLQIMAGRFREEVILKVGAAYQTVTEHHTARSALIEGK
jgi:aspartyl-tRNA(Asn)/glutamyl-tRNA(Gln) amidotransferase subunit A